MRYLVATDGSTEADAAVQYAATGAIPFDATLEVVTVLTPETKLIDGEIVLPGDHTAIDNGERTLGQARRLARETAEDRNADLSIETELLTGRPADAITDHAEAVDADAIYIGHRGLSEAREQVVGSVAKSVLDKASVPVTIIK